MEKIKITLDVNGKPCEIEVAPNDTLLDVLRDELDLTGSKESCGEGACGSCTIHMDGKPVRSCLTLALEAVGNKIKTVEGLADGDQLSELQESFINHGAVQCGFCTPGMLMSADALLNGNPNPDRDEVKKAIAGNICRCTGYAKIVDAVTHTGLPHEGCPDCGPHCHPDSQSDNQTDNKGGN